MSRDIGQLVTLYYETKQNKTKPNRSVTCCTPLYLLRFFSIIGNAHNIEQLEYK